MHLTIDKCCKLRRILLGLGLGINVIPNKRIGKRCTGEGAVLWAS